MNKHDRFYDDACSEARDVINSWMNDKLRDELEVDADDGNWHEDSDTFLNRFLTPHSSKMKTKEPEINFYGDDESAAVNHWMANVHLKLNSYTLSEYEASEKKKKPIVPKDPRLAMEVRQQKVKEARAKREEKAKLRLQRHMEQKQNEAIAREIVKQEAIEKAQKEKMEEEAIQREMVKIRKQMLDLKKKHQVEVKSLSVPQASANNALAQSSIKKTRNSVRVSKEKTTQNLIAEDAEKVDLQLKQRMENIKKFNVFQQQKLVRKCFHHWIKIVLSKRAAMGQAKALADWRLMLATWSSWRKYYFEQAAQKDAQKHEETVKQMKVFAHVASIKYRQRVMRKCFLSWQKFVKMEQFAKELQKEQEDTKKKMDALLGLVQRKSVSTNCGLVLQTVEDEEIFAEDTIPSPKHEKLINQIHSRAISSKQNLPKHAWQIRKSDVQKLTTKQIENMGGHTASPHDLTRVNKLGSENVKTSNHNDRMKASKSLIARQREMITKQKQVIDEQQRLLQDKNSSESNSVSSPRSTSSTASTKVRSFQPPKRPKSLVAMEKRAEERLRRREKLEERKRLAEIDRIEKLRQEEIEEKKREEEEKKKKQEEIKRLKQLEIEKELERKAFIAKMHQLRLKAEEHHKRTILRKYGLTPLLNTKKKAEEKMAVAHFHFETKLCRKVLITWYKFLKQDREFQETRAQQLFKDILKRRCFCNWLKYGEAMSILEAKADIHYDRKLLSSYLTKWENYVIDERLSYFSKEELAEEHNTRRLLRRGFKIFYAYKQNIKREQIRSQRVANMRKKVAQLLPDFDPEISQDAF